jgi:hypothetical protein
MRAERRAMWSRVSVRSAFQSPKRSGKSRHGMPVVKTEKSLTDAIDRHRRRARELKADLHRITSAPYPASHAKARMREQVEVLAQRGAVNVSQLVEHNGDLEFPTQQTQVAILNAQPGAVGFVQVPDTLALLAWTFKDSLLARIDAEVMAEADDAAALSIAERQRQEAVVQSDLLDVERQESSLVWRAKVEGLPVEHRADANPLAVLSVKLVTVLPGSSKGMSYPWGQVGGR